MADEIRKYNITCLPGSLRSCLTTKRAKDVGKLLEELANRLAECKFKHEYDINRLQAEINGLRNEMQSMTDSLTNSLAL